MSSWDPSVKPSDSLQPSSPSSSEVPPTKEFYELVLKNFSDQLRDALPPKYQLDFYNKMSLNVSQIGGQTILNRLVEKVKNVFHANISDYALNQICQEAKQGASKFLAGLPGLKMKKTVEQMMSTAVLRAENMLVAQEAKKDFTKELSDLLHCLHPLDGKKYDALINKCQGLMEEAFDKIVDVATAKSDRLIQKQLLFLFHTLAIATLKKELEKSKTFISTAKQMQELEESIASSLYVLEEAFMNGERFNKGYREELGTWSERSEIVSAYNDLLSSLSSEGTKGIFVHAFVNGFVHLKHGRLEEWSRIAKGLEQTIAQKLPGPLVQVAQRPRLEERLRVRNDRKAAELKNDVGKTIALLGQARGLVGETLRVNLEKALEAVIRKIDQTKAAATRDKKALDFMTINLRELIEEEAGQLLLKSGEMDILLNDLSNLDKEIKAAQTGLAKIGEHVHAHELSQVSRAIYEGQQGLQILKVPAVHAFLNFKVNRMRELDSNLLSAKEYLRLRNSGRACESEEEAGERFQNEPTTGGVLLWYRSRPFLNWSSAGSHISLGMRIPGRARYLTLVADFTKLAPAMAAMREEITRLMNDRQAVPQEDFTIKELPPIVASPTSSPQVSPSSSPPSTPRSRSSEPPEVSSLRLSAEQLFPQLASTFAAMPCKREILERVFSMRDLFRAKEISATELNQLKTDFYLLSAILKAYQEGRVVNSREELAESFQNNPNGFFLWEVGGKTMGVALRLNDGTLYTRTAPFESWQSTLQEMVEARKAGNVVIEPASKENKNKAYYLDVEDGSNYGYNSYSNDFRKVMEGFNKNVKDIVELEKSSGNELVEEAKTNLRNGFSPQQFFGLEEGFSQQDLRKAFRKLSLQFHVDKMPGVPQAQAIFQYVSAAYELLGHKFEKG
jgi:DnaJ domain